jgi:hypothetical protein
MSTSPLDNERGVLGMYTDEPIGMDHPIFMARTEARHSAVWAAHEGLSLTEMLVAVRQRVLDLFDEVPQPLVDATATTAYLEALTSQARREPDDD